jgi:rare lipoprotein A
MPTAGNWGGLNAVTVTDEKPRSPRLEGDHPTLPSRHQVKVTPLTSLLLAWGLADCQCNKTRKECVLRHHCTTQRRSIKIAAFTGALTFVIATGLQVGPLLARSHPSETGARHHSKTITRHTAVRHLAKLRRGGIRHARIGSPPPTARGEQGYRTSGIASVYSDGRTANGERMNAGAMTAAHRTLPFGCMVTVVNSRNGRSAIVRINDRGPFVRGRVIDLSPAAARVLGVDGLAPVSLSVGGRRV